MKSKIIVLSVLLLFSPILSHAGDEAGANGDRISAWVVSLGYRVLVELQQREMAGTPLDRKVTSSAFQNALKTRLVLINDNNEKELTNAFGEVKDVKFLPASATGESMILLNGKVFEALYQANKPDYRLVAHAYFYAAGVDDSRYNYSSKLDLVIESHPDPITLPDEPDRVLTGYATYKYCKGTLSGTPAEPPCPIFIFEKQTTTVEEEDGLKSEFRSTSWDEIQVEIDDSDPYLKEAFDNCLKRMEKCEIRGQVNSSAYHPYIAPKSIRLALSCDNGFTFASDTPQLGVACKDPSGIIWGSAAMDEEGKRLELSRLDAFDYCNKRGARLPTKEDFERLQGFLTENGSYNPTIGLPSMLTAFNNYGQSFWGTKFWSSTDASPDEYGRPRGWYFEVGFTVRSFSDWTWMGVKESSDEEKFRYNVRCVIPN